MILMSGILNTQAQNQSATMGEVIQNHIPKYNSNEPIEQLSPSILYETDGKIGLGTLSPQEKLHVAGSLEVEGSIKGVGNNDLIPKTKNKTI